MKLDGSTHRMEASASAHLNGLLMTVAISCQVLAPTVFAQCPNKDDIVLILPDFVRMYIDTDFDGDFDTWTQWGLPGDFFAGGEPLHSWQDGYEEVAIYRGVGGWYVKHNVHRPGFNDPPAAGDMHIGDFGLLGDRPLCGDFNGDGRDEAAVLQGDPNVIQFIVIDGNRDLLSDGSNIVYEFPAALGPNDWITSGQMNGDRLEDILIWRNATGYFEFFFNRQSDFPASPSLRVQFGLPGDLPLVGDANGDGHDDLMVFRPLANDLFINYFEAGAPLDGYGPDSEVDRVVHYSDAIASANASVGRPGLVWNVAAFAFDYDNNPIPDSDSDGVPNCLDGCPSDANKTEPGECGCGVPDTHCDNDGVADCRDGCPCDRNKIEPGQCGCGNPDNHCDNDGVADCLDGCPCDRNKTEPGQCGCGNPDNHCDNDGVADCLDGCPCDRHKTDPGQCGCGNPDNHCDDDGVADCLDACPCDRNKTEPGQCGCGTPDDHCDNDGTADCLDGCPCDRNKTEPGTCGCGAPDTDSDNDGIADCVDLCPGTELGVPVNEDGCPDGGACCFDIGICLNGLADFEECEVVGGIFLGMGVTCAGDPDHDGAVGCDDGCPMDGGKTAPGICGCGVSEETDRDDDGVPDCIDDCPDTPVGMIVDNQGCPTIGACCFDSGVCVNNANPADCQVVGGFYQGNGSICFDGCAWPGDFDLDRDIDLIDILAFTECLSGPDGPVDSDASVDASHCLSVFDTDLDEDLDLLDSAALQNRFGAAW